MVSKSHHQSVTGGRIESTETDLGTVDGQAPRNGWRLARCSGPLGKLHIVAALDCNEDMHRAYQSQSDWTHVQKK
jgi:hypothetical protein